MVMFSKESLETLRQRIDLVEVLSSHIDLKRAGSAYKALCPFHDEKTPSFMVQRGDTHYHCFGCGAHGDAIQFLIDHQKMNFNEAIESLAERFQVHLEKVEGEDRGPNKKLLHEALEAARRFFHFLLLHTEEGHKALEYLYGRGIDLDFIRRFQVGLAPKQGGLLRQALHAKGVKDVIMVEAGLLRQSDSGGYRDFFSDRITFPIHHPSGSVIGFSARKYKEETFGGKYVNTPETPVFKKSKTLFGLNFSRRRIAKERRAIIVEGQVDALRLIQAGFNIAVAGQGTAFGEGHVKELISLGVNEVFLALDADEAGQEAATKIGNLFQKIGVSVQVVQMPPGSDPDSYLREKGAEGFLELMEKSIQYLEFLVQHRARYLDMDSPAAKNELVQVIAQQIREWKEPVMVHESLRKLAHLTRVPEDTIRVDQLHNPNIYIRKSGNIGLQSVDPNRILEGDFLRWLLLSSKDRQRFVEIARTNITHEAFLVAPCAKLYRTITESDKTPDLLSLVIDLDDPEAQQMLEELQHKKIDKDHAEEHFVQTIQKILDRNWMERREELRREIQSGQCSDDEVLELVKRFDNLKRSPPKVVMNES